MRIVFVLVALLSLSAHAKSPVNQTNAIKNDWLALLANGCDLAKHKVYTPFEASVLRNTPYALAGYAFKSEGLRALFSADGGWYVPKSKTAPKFAPQVSACIAKIKAFERSEKFIGDKGFKELIFKDRATYLDIRSHNQHFVGGTPGYHGSKTGAEWHGGVDCPKCTKLQTYQLMCSAALSCALVVPGDGSIRVE